MQRHLAWRQDTDLFSSWIEEQGFPNQQPVPKSARLGDRNGGLASPSTAIQRSAPASVWALHEHARSHRPGPDGRGCLRLWHRTRLDRPVGRSARVGGDIVCRCALPQTRDRSTPFQVLDRSRDPAHGARHRCGHLAVEADRPKATMTRRAGARTRAAGQGTDLGGRRWDTRRTNAREGGKVAQGGFRRGARTRPAHVSLGAAMVPGAPADPECPVFSQVVAGRSSAQVWMLRATGLFRGVLRL
jgi:hypothetical protein